MSNVEAVEKVFQSWNFRGQPARAGEERRPHPPFRQGTKNRPFSIGIGATEKKKLLEAAGRAPARGYAKLYMDHVLQAEHGCDLDFLRKP